MKTIRHTLTKVDGWWVLKVFVDGSHVGGTEQKGKPKLYEIEYLVRQAVMQHEQRQQSAAAAEP